MTNPVVELFDVLLTGTFAGEKDASKWDLDVSRIHDICDLIFSLVDLSLHLLC